MGEVIGLSDVRWLGCHTTAYQIRRTFFPGVLPFQSELKEWEAMASEESRRLEETFREASSKSSSVYVTANTKYSCK